MPTACGERGELSIWSTLFVTPPEKYTTPEAWVSLRNNVIDVQETLSSDVFKLFEREIAFPKRYHTTFLEERIKTFRRTYGQRLDAGHVPSLAERDELVKRWHGVLQQTDEYGLDCMKLADEFIAESTELIRKYS